MLRRFWRRRRPDQQVDQTGPATVYPHHGGAYLSERAARPDWNGPTLIPTVSPLVTPGQMKRGGGQR
ncbi:hypothetical protein ACGFI9_37120 [Micromonospora sp. NPDC048930]|uniref:hypothetical protein n=1 Tax=Micromonospora sp. NPDC048930 TaxID=3364261 RepID=UPI0037142B0F